VYYLLGVLYATRGGLVVSPVGMQTVVEMLAIDFFFPFRFLLFLALMNRITTKPLVLPLTMNT
jgi:hypothetical protein